MSWRAFGSVPMSDTLPSTEAEKAQGSELSTTVPPVIPYVEAAGAAQNPFDRPAGADAAAPACLGAYELLAELGRGGMGVVYRARQRAANRLVALKLIRPDRLADMPAGHRALWLERFRAESRAAARI